MSSKLQIGLIVNSSSRPLQVVQVSIHQADILSSLQPTILTRVSHCGVIPNTLARRHFCTIGLRNRPNCLIGFRLFDFRLAFRSPHHLRVSTQPETFDLLSTARRLQKLDIIMGAFREWRVLDRVLNMFTMHAFYAIYPMLFLHSLC